MWQGSPHCLQVTLREYQLVTIKNKISIMLSVFTFCFCCCLAHYRWFQGVEQTLQANRRRPNGTYVLPTSGCSYFSCHAWCSIQKQQWQILTTCYGYFHGWTAEPRKEKSKNHKGSLIFFEPTKIKLTTLSTTVAELYALMKCCGTCQMLRGLIKDITGLSSEIHMRTDANNLVTTASTTHVPE